MDLQVCKIYISFFPFFLILSTDDTHLAIGEAQGTWRWREPNLCAQGVLCVCKATTVNNNYDTIHRGTYEENPRDPAILVDLLTVLTAQPLLPLSFTVWSFIFVVFLVCLCDTYLVLGYKHVTKFFCFLILLCIASWLLPRGSSGEFTKWIHMASWRDHTTTVTLLVLKLVPEGVSCSEQVSSWILPISSSQRCFCKFRVSAWQMR